MTYYIDSFVNICTHIFLTNNGFSERTHFLIVYIMKVVSSCHLSVCMGLLRILRLLVSQLDFRFFSKHVNK
jgi:hypothetical protein